MNGRGTAVLILVCAVFGTAIGARSQDQNTKTKSDSVTSPQVTYPNPTNLKVLPKDISGEDINKLMHQYQQALGVPCGYCHEENSETKQINYASDENPLKETARFMITMTSDINNKYLSQLRDSRYAEPITCGNCHQGQVEPPTFKPKSLK